MRESFDSLRTDLNGRHLVVSPKLYKKGPDFLSKALAQISQTPTNRLNIFDPTRHAKGVVNIGCDVVMWRITPADSSAPSRNTGYLIELNLVGESTK